MVLSSSFVVSNYDSSNLLLRLNWLISFLFIVYPICCGVLCCGVRIEGAASLTLQYEGDSACGQGFHIRLYGSQQLVRAAINDTNCLCFLTLPPLHEDVCASNELTHLL